MKTQMETVKVRQRMKRKEKGTVYLTIKSVRGENKLKVKVVNALSGVEVTPEGISKIGGFTKNELLGLVEELYNPNIPRWEDEEAPQGQPSF